MIFVFIFKLQYSSFTEIHVRVDYAELIFLNT